MIKFDHLRIPVTDLARSRDWYIRTLGLKIEFEVPDRQTVKLETSIPRSRTGPRGESSLPTARGSRTGATGPSSRIAGGREHEGSDQERLGVG